MIEINPIQIPELTGDAQRRVYIYLPESYRYYPDQRYPVLYMFDGHNIFFDSDATYGKSWGMGDYMDATGTQMIIAAIECNHSPDQGRLKEYSPYSFQDKKFGKIQGLGDITMRWLVHTFKPLMDRCYRTLPDRQNTFIAGSSMGGLMSLYAVLAYNSWFAGAAALSPSIWVAPDRLHSLLKETHPEHTVVYMDYGELELSNHPRMQEQFARFAAALITQGIHTTCRIVPGGRHCEACWEKQIPFFMNTLLYN